MVKTADKKSKAGDVVALQDFRYDSNVGRVTRGQVFPLAGHPNDQLLLTYRHVQEIKPGIVLKECGECGALFLEDGGRERHGLIMHEMQCSCGWTPDSADPATMRHQLDQHQTLRLQSARRDRLQTRGGRVRMYLRSRELEGARWPPEGSRNGTCLPRL